MKVSAFNATCPFELGDRVDIDSSIHTITDIVCCHYIKAGKIVFAYELDNSGKYIRIFRKTESGTSEAHP